MLAAGHVGSLPFFERRIDHCPKVKQAAMNMAKMTGNATTPGDLSAQRVTAPSRLTCMGMRSGIASLIGPLMQLAFVGVLTLAQTLVPLVAIVAIILVATLAVSVVYGQNGSRLIARMEASDAMARDDDRFWKLGILYVNRGVWAKVSTPTNASCMSGPIRLASSPIPKMRMLWAWANMP